jgi:hypothetical protein
VRGPIDSNQSTMARPWCFYHVQGEEGESPEEPNAFQVRVGGWWLWNSARSERACIPILIPRATTERRPLLHQHAYPD